MIWFWFDLPPIIVGALDAAVFIGWMLIVTELFKLVRGRKNGQATQAN